MVQGICKEDAKRMQRGCKAIKPLISVIVPIYNTEKYLRRCLQSIVGQTYKNLEIILINDGSTDSCDTICHEFMNKDRRIVYAYQQNGGQSRARNHALELARGEYYVFVDSDDYLEEDAVEAFLSAAISEKADIVILGVKIILKDGVHSLSRKHLDNRSHEELSRLLLFDEIGNHVIFKMFSSKLWRGIRFPEGIVYEDMYVMPQLVLKAEKIVYRDIFAYYYERTNENATTNDEASYFDSWHRFSKFCAYTSHEDAGKVLKDEELILWGKKQALHEVAKTNIIEGAVPKLSRKEKEIMLDYLKKNQDKICMMSFQDRLFLWSIKNGGLLCKLYGRTKYFFKTAYSKLRNLI